MPAELLKVATLNRVVVRVAGIMLLVNFHLINTKIDTMVDKVGQVVVMEEATIVVGVMEWGTVGPMVMARHMAQMEEVAAMVVDTRTIQEVVTTTRAMVAREGVQEEVVAVVRMMLAPHHPIHKVPVEMAMEVIKAPSMATMEAPTILLVTVHTRQNRPVMDNMQHIIIMAEETTRPLIFMSAKSFGESSTPRKVIPITYR